MLIFFFKVVDYIKALLGPGSTGGFCCEHSHSERMIERKLHQSP
jgi:hypothetical protein